MDKPIYNAADLTEGQIEQMIKAVDEVPPLDLSHLMPKIDLYHFVITGRIVAVIDGNPLQIDWNDL